MTGSWNTKTPAQKNAEYISMRNEKEQREALERLSKTYAFKTIAKNVNLKEFARSHKETINVLADLERRKDAVLKEVSTVFSQIDSSNISDAKARKVFQKLISHLQTLLEEENRMTTMVFETKRKSELIDNQVGHQYDNLKNIFTNKTIEMNLKHKQRLDTLEQAYKKQVAKITEKREEERLTLEVEHERATNDLAKAVEIVARLQVTFNHTLADIRSKVNGTRTILQMMHQAADKAGVDIGTIPSMIQGTEKSRLNTALKDLGKHTLGK